MTAATADSRRPRVVFAYRYGLLGGVSAQLLNRYPAFSERFDVRVLYEQDHGMVGRFPDGVAEVTPDGDAMAAAVRRLAPDLLLVIDSPAFIEAWSGAGRPGRLVVEVHTTTGNVAYLDRIGPDTGVSAFVTVSRYMESALRERGIDRIAPLWVVPNCLDERWFAPPEAPTLATRPLLWVGKLDDHKRWREALTVMEAVVGRANGAGPVTPLLVGGRTSPEAEVRELLARIYSSESLADSVWWPFVAYERMPALYRSVGASGGALLLTTRDESFGMTVAEALLMGCPVAAPRIGALPELLPDDALYPPDDWSAAERLADRLLHDERLRERVTAAADEIRAVVAPQRALDAFGAMAGSVVGN